MPLQRRLGPAEQVLDLQEIAVSEDRLERRDAGIGAQHEDAVEAGLLGELAGIDLEGGAASGLAQVTPVGGVADQGLVAPLELLFKAGDDGLTVGLVFLGLVAADDVARAAGLDLLDEELGFAAGAFDQQRGEARRIGEHVLADDGAAPLAGAEDVFVVREERRSG